MHKISERIATCNRVVDVVILSPSDVESAVRQFVCDYFPEYGRRHIVNPNIQIGCSVTIITDRTRQALEHEEKQEFVDQATIEKDI